MARDFTGANRYLEAQSVLPSLVAPLSMACWFNSASATARDALFLMRSNGSNNHKYGFELRGNETGDPLWFIARSGAAAAAVAETTTGYTVGTWHHACGVAVSTTDRSAYIDGGSRGDNIDLKTPDSIEDVRIGRNWGSSNLYYDGQACEAAIWSAALTAAEVASLAKGFSPLMVRPSSLVAYWPLIGRYSPEIDLVGGANLVLSNTPATYDHPRIIMPSDGG